MCPLSRTVTRKIILSYAYQKRQPILRRTFQRELLYKEKLQQQFESFVPFNELMAKRKAEASRSIVVQIKNKTSYDDLMTYCLKFGSVRNTLFYSLNYKSNFVIVEYDDYTSSQKAIQYATISNSQENLPVTSPFLWLRADLDQTPPSKDLIPTCIYENNELPSLDTLNNELSLSNNFSDDILVLYKRLKLTDTAIRLRYLTAMQIEDALKGMFAYCQIIPFGSSTNSFGKVNCDLDLILDFNKYESQVHTSRLQVHSKSRFGQRHLEIVADMLQYFLPGCNNIRRILRARVPIVKYKQELTGVECDFSAYNLSGHFMSEWLYLCSSYDSRVCPLVFAVRFWAKEMNLTNPNPGKWISNFSLTLLVLFFLQSVKIIPTLDTLQKYKRREDSKFIDGEDCGFLSDLRLLTDPGTEENSDSLFKLLIKFFEFYASFDSRLYALSLNSGKLIPKPLYKPLYIVNPLEKGLNVSQNVSEEECERLKISARTALWNIECSINSGESSTKWGLLDLIRSQKSNPMKLRSKSGMKGVTNIAIKELFEEN